MIGKTFHNLLSEIMLDMKHIWVQINIAIFKKSQYLYAFLSIHKALKCVLKLIDV